MTQNERLFKLNTYLLNESPEYKEQAEMFAGDEKSQFRLFRSLVNMRMPKKISRKFIGLQDEYLEIAIKEKGIKSISDCISFGEEIYLIQCDITTLAADVVVNAANSRLLGCFCPCHGCIDNAIHTFSGVELRLACAELMKAQGHEEPAGQAKITEGFNLPAKYIIHTVGPIVGDTLCSSDCEKLSSCYASCLKLADENGCRSIAFCCISTGEFHFPNKEAAEIAVCAVKKYKKQTNSKIKVIFNVFKRQDYDIYREQLGGNS